MVTLSKFISNIYNITLIFLTLLYFEFVILLRSVTGNLPNSSTERMITNAQYLQLIEQKNPTILYTRKLKTNCLEECSVCLSEIEEGEDVRMLHCRHMFHRNCLDKWLLQWWATCPLCRAQVVPDEIVARHHQLQNQVDYDNGDEEIIFLISALHNNSLHRFF